MEAGLEYEIKRSDYIYDKENNLLTIMPDTRHTFNFAVKSFCEDYQIDKKEFNVPVVIREGVESCSHMFQGCESFNQPVIIPYGVKTCEYMFGGCMSFNQSVTIPESVENCNHMFWNCTSFNQKIEIPDSVMYCDKMFQDCKSFNQTVTFPDAVHSMHSVFQGCASLNKEIILPDNILYAAAMFKDCESFNQPVALKEKVNNSCSMFSGCKSFNQPVKIPENVLEMSEMFRDCENLNQPIELSVLSSSWCDHMFLNTSSLQKDNVTIHCTAAGRKNLAKTLKKMWGTEVSADEIKVSIKTAEKKTKNTNVITKVSCFTVDNNHWELAEDKLTEYTKDTLYEEIENRCFRNKFKLLEIEEKSKNSMRCLTISCEGELCAIGITDEWNGITHYYNSGVRGENIAIQGSLYPQYMTTNDCGIIRNIIKDFLKNGKPSKNVKWIKE